jgi:hypothetical protein
LALGAGFDVALPYNWIARIEYLYVDLGAWGCPAFLLNIAERSLPRLTLRGGGLASKDAVS